MASRSSKFLTTEVIDIEDGHKDEADLELSLAQNMHEDLMLMLAVDDQDDENMPIFYFKEGNA